MARTVTREQGKLCPVVTHAIRAASSQGMLRQVGARSFSNHSPWGEEAWRHDKNIFKTWCTAAMAPGTKAEREMYGFLAMAFGDVDADKDGLIDADEFDLLCEKVAALPRRFGMAPSWEKEFNGNMEARKASRGAMFVALDIRNGPARGTIGLKQFCRWARAHVGRKVSTLQVKSKVDFAHVEDYDEAEFMNYLEYAVNNPTSGAYTSLYKFLLTIFVESDKNCKGTINRQEFDVLLDRAAAVPRQFGLAPNDSSEEIRNKLFNSMDDNKSGTITFRKFLAWTMAHSKLKIQLQREGRGYKK